LTLNEITQIVDLLLDDLRKRLADRRITLRLTDAARHFIAEQGFDPAYGARPLRRFITREVETRLGRALLRGDAAEGDQVSIDVVNGQLMITSLVEASSESAVV
jgi:ATP-dependent Clp protease ATP-binding subunit ClpB